MQATAKAGKSSTPRVFMGLSEIAGYYANLGQGLRGLGVDATCVDAMGHPFQYAAEQRRFLRLLQHVSRQARSTPRTAWLQRIGWAIAYRALLLPLFLWAVWRFDTFIFCYGQSFWQLRDLPILKALGKQIIFVFHGSDSRPPYLDGSIMAADRGVTIEDCIAQTRRQKQKVQTIERYADVIISNRLSSQLHSKPFVEFIRVGIPYQTPTQESAGEQASASAAVRILHSPSHPLAKGTPTIRQVIENLRQKGLAIEYVELTGKPNREVIEALIECDFVIDQLYSDTPMAGFAAEAAFYAKPVVVGGYGWAQLENELPADCVPPTLRCHPDHIEQAV
ncbi:MAG: hypothetical protein M3Q45_06980, partial [Chloroflexota bacterium]|nr:hypothetical protein [Chloroflexota bacterium]